VFDVIPPSQVLSPRVNFLERLWAYHTIKDLLEKVAKGKMNSCGGANQPPQTRTKRRSPKVMLYDDEDYEGSGGGGGGGVQDEYEDDEYRVEDIMDVVGDADIVMCNNLERALYLSLKYEFVTPLTSLVVVKPDEGTEQGDFGEMGATGGIRITSAGSKMDRDGGAKILSIMVTVAAAVAQRVY
jgi:hypothetical protein